MNGFPNGVIDPILKKKEGHNQNAATPAPPEETNNESDSKREHILCLPYVRGLSEKIEKTCRSIKTTKLKLAFKPIRTIRQSLVRVKNRVPNKKRKGVVYEIPCCDCDQVYVGETGRTMKKRISEHKQAVRHFDDRNGIAVHAFQYDHQIDWENASIADTEQFYWKKS